MEIRLNKSAVIVIQITNEMQRDYAECQRLADIPGGDGKLCTGCSLDIPSSCDLCLADILNEQDPSWMVMQEQTTCNQTKCNMQYKGRCMSKKPPCIRPGK